MNDNEVENIELILYFLTSKYLLRLPCIREQTIKIPINFLTITIFIIIWNETKNQSNR